MEVIIITLLAVGVVTGVAGYNGYWVLRPNSSVDSENWERIAEELGLDFTEGVSGDSPYITGIYDEVPVSVITEVERRGNSQTQRTVVSATVNSEALAGVEVRSRRAHHRLIGVVHRPGIKTGDPELDSRFIFEADDPSEIEVLTDPAVKAALIEAVDEYGDFRIEFSEVLHRARGAYNDPQRLRRCIEAMTAVAKAVDETVWS